jgi:hypothetical protein
MSHQASAYVKGLLRDQVTRREKLLLFVLADYHSTETRLSYPSLRTTLAPESLMDEREAQRVLDGLEGRIIERVPGCGRGRTTGYRFIELDAEIPGYVPPPLRAQKGGQKDGQKGGHKDGQKGGHKDGQIDDAIRKEQELELEPEQEQNLPLIADDDYERVEKGGQTQHAIVRERIQKLYNAANPATPCPWDARTGKILKDTLDRLCWPDAALLAAVENRFASEVVLSEDPLRWISTLASYVSGPLNQFNRPLGGPKHANATAASQDRLRAEFAICDELDRRDAAQKDGRGAE